jgi:hypothetical protein
MYTLVNLKMIPVEHTPGIMARRQWGEGNEGEGMRR